MLGRKKKVETQPEPVQVTQGFQPSQAYEPIDLGEATAEGVRSIQDIKKLKFITEIQSLEELRLVAYALTEAKFYGITMQQDFMDNYLLLKTSYRRQRTREIIEMIQKAKEELTAETSRITNFLMKGRGL